MTEKDATTTGEPAPASETKVEKQAKSPERVLPVNIYVALIIAAGTIASISTALAFPFRPSMVFVFLCAGAVALARRSIPLGGRVEMLASEPFLFGALLAIGPTDAIIVAGLCALIFCLFRPRRLPLHRLMFNVASLCLTMAAASASYVASGGRMSDELSIESSLLPVMIAVIVFFLVNSFTVSAAIALSERVPIVTVFREKFIWSLPSHLASGSVAFIMAVAVNNYGIYAIGLVVPPSVLIYYFQRGQKERLEEHEKHLAEIRQVNADLEAKASELQQINERLEAANRMKTEFLANMSHELRTPLAAVIGFSELLLNEDVCRLEKQPSGWVKDILSSGQHLLEMINDILNLSKIEAGKMNVRLQTMCLQTVIKDAVGTMRPMAQNKNITLKDASSLRDDSGRPLMASLDPMKLRQVLHNLLSNAVKFTPEGGRVVVTTRTDEEDLYLAVADTGIGIDPREQQKIFREFMQVDSSMSRRYQGTGLGLALVKKVAEMHGGSVSVQSQLGEGATFVVHLPGCLLGPQTASEPMDKPVAETETVTRRDQPPKNDWLGTILVVEDNSTNRKLMRQLLELSGYRTLEARTAEEGMEMASVHRPDLILMDINLPDMDGYEATRRLCAQRHTRDIPVLAVTAHVGETDEAQAYEAGCAGFIRKPIDQTTFAGLIGDYILISPQGVGETQI